MASLTNITRHVDNLIGVPSDIERPLEWRKADLQIHLRGCLSTQAFAHWHACQLKWIQSNISNQHLEELCTDVGTSLKPAIGKLNRLKSWANSSTARLPAKARTDRHLVISALQNILNSFKTFQDVKTRLDMTEPKVKKEVMGYLEKVYETMIILGMLLYPPQDDDDGNGWFDIYREYLIQCKLGGFLFDSEDDYKRAQNPTMSWVLEDEHAMPGNCLPTWSEPPLRYLNPSPYGPPILSNARKEEDEQGNMLGEENEGEEEGIWF